ncbi:uncharacterized protein EHS24_006673 [Apiotrichum porosum]|uniref:HTH APSES-type domain-containing protein n=1 Tax=Apiotrichum porosum TaxID=105984 RepID=A0A427Y1Z2_9TREE|nr:uncharacterized protein EHS24_006673 [Apiotrichum porosum]RSH85080.1 hypothetical protein EHS24_006673 [Apiotrichum porosum]
MARLARPTATASNPSTPIPATTLSPALAGAVPSPSSGAAGVATPVAGPSRTRGTRSSARRSLAAAATAPSSSASASTSAAASPASSGGVDRIPKSHVAPKAHGLRNALNARDRTPCPFPSEFGGSEHCGVADEDEADDVLMAICAATAGLGNLALSPDELASIAFERGWLRPPSVAVAPATMIQNAIRMHQSRCSKATPTRRPLVQKYQLAGSTAEAVLGPALHPTAFEGPARPKGPVWFLSSEVGKAKWRNPFAGIVVPKTTVRKPAAPRPKTIKPKKEDTRRKDKKDKEQTPAAASAASDATVPPPVPRIKLRLSAAAGDATPGTTPGTPPATPGEDSDVGESMRSSRSVTVESSVTPMLFSTPPPPSRKHQRKHTSVLDSSDSDSSDSDDDMTAAAAASRHRQPRHIVLPPLAAGAGSTRFPPQAPPSRPAPPAHSPLGVLFFSPLTTATLPLPTLLQSPFPHHSLDNTIWAARNKTEPLAFDASSSSSDDELCEDWGNSSGLMIKADDDEVLSGSWPQDDDPKLSAATTAMRELFPYEEGAVANPCGPSFNQLDNRQGQSDSSSVADSSSTINAVFQGKLKNVACPAALPAWALSSPVSSPSMNGRSLPAFVETSPTQYLSRYARDVDRSMEMDVDVSPDDEAWLDESGQLPVHAEDTFSDVEVGSTLGGEITTPERDRQLQTAEWAQASSLLIKQEPEDYYPSPAATSSTEPDDTSLLFQASRESTASAPSPSSGSSELTPYEFDDSDNAQEFLLGPESLSIEELDEWLPCAAKVDRTPLRGRGRVARHDPSRCSGNWGSIGVNNPIIPLSGFIPKPTPPPLVRKRSLRSCTRRNRSTPRKADSRPTPVPSPVSSEVLVLETPTHPEPETIDIDIELEDAIGAADLEMARVEAEEREEQYRAQKRAEAEENHRRWQACRRAFADATASGSGSQSPVLSPPNPPAAEPHQSSPWIETPNNGSGTWGASDIVPDMTSSLTLSPLALQISPPPELTSLDPKALLSPPSQTTMMMLDSALSQVEIDQQHAAPPLPAPALPPPAPAATAPAPHPVPYHPVAIAPAQQPQQQQQQQPHRGHAQQHHHPIAPKPVNPSPPKHIAPRVVSPKVSHKPMPIAIAPAPVHPHEVKIAPRPEVKVAPKPEPRILPKPEPSKLVPKAASVPPIAPTPATTSAPATTPATATSSATSTSSTPAPTPAQVPTRTVSPIARTSTSSPATASVASSSSLSSAPSSTATSTTTTTASTPAPQPRPSTPSSGGTTKRLLPGIDACVIDNLPCYSHVWEAPKGPKCTVLRRLDTDFVNGTALLTALGVPPNKYAEYLQAPSPTLASHRTVPLISPQGHHHAPGVPGVWIPLVEARELARKLGLPDSKLLANILREDLFQLFKELAGISLRHTSSTESFGMPFVTQPHPRQMVPPANANSRSTPNLTALGGASAPNPTHMRPGVPAGAKGPLVRGPVAPPDGAPQPKRRRATVVVVGATGPAAATANAARQPINPAVPRAVPTAAAARPAPVVATAPGNAHAAPVAAVRQPVPPAAQVARPVVAPTPVAPAPTVLAAKAAPDPPKVAPKVAPLMAVAPPPAAPRRTRASLGAAVGAK